VPLRVLPRWRWLLARTSVVALYIFCRPGAWSLLSLLQLSRPRFTSVVVCLLCRGAYTLFSPLLSHLFLP
jgi:hypothetical protein